MARRQAGQALVETALTVPVIVLLLVAIVTAGYLLNSQLVVTNACREGARSGVVGQSATLIRQRVSAYLESGGLAPDQASIQIDGAGAESGSLLEVQVDYPMPLPVAVTGLPSTLTLSAKSTMRIE